MPFQDPQQSRHQRQERDRDRDRERDWHRSKDRERDREQREKRDPDRGRDKEHRDRDQSKVSENIPSLCNQLFNIRLKTMDGHTIPIGEGTITITFNTFNLSIIKL